MTRLAVLAALLLAVALLRRERRPRTGPNGERIVLWDPDIVWLPADDEPAGGPAGWEK